MSGQPAAARGGDPVLPAPEPPGPVALPPGPCLGRLAAAGHVVERATAPPDANGACAIADPVRLRAAAPVRAGGPPIAFPGTPLLSCETAGSLAAWTSRIAGPSLEAALGSPLAAIQTGPGFACRSRNRQSGAKVSAHGSGRAVDIAAFALADGRTLPASAMPALRPGETEVRETLSAPAAALHALRLSACGFFTTVLGPGADPFHADHLHLDEERRGRTGRSLLCQ